MKKLYLNNWNVNATKILDEIDRQVKELGGEPAAQFGHDYYFAKEPIEVEVKTRYSSKVAKATIKSQGGNLKVIFNEPQRAITSGQAAVFYDGDTVVGGGTISATN